MTETQTQGQGQGQTMNTKELAAQLNGRSYRFALTKAEADAAREAGIVVVYGASDDLMEFDGAIRDEVGCYDGGTAYLTCYGLIENDCGDGDCPYFAALKAKGETIEAVWCDEPEGPSWQYKTAIPHVTFEALSDEPGEVYCVGIVFALSDVEAGRE